MRFTTIKTNFNKSHARHRLLCPKINISLTTKLSTTQCASHVRRHGNLSRVKQPILRFQWLWIGESTIGLLAENIRLLQKKLELGLNFF